MRERNLRRVKTRVTVRELHSDVSVNTELMHTYCVRTLPNRKSHSFGTLARTGTVASMGKGDDALYFDALFTMLLPVKMNPGRDNACI